MSAPSTNSPPPSASPEEAVPAIECRGLSFRYQKPLVLEEVSFTVAARESICMIGPNGGGKSTLLKLVLGLLHPGSGILRVFGETPERARGAIGYVPQAMRFDPLFPVNALDIVLMGRLDRIRFGRYSRECREVAYAALEEVGLPDLAKRPFSDLSGGQRQRILVARALACEPRLLLLDEPTASIDLSVEAQILETLANLRGRLSILMVTHDLDLVAALGDSVLCVNHRVHRHGLPLSGDTIREIYSGRKRIEHDRRARHQQGDHSACEHD